MEATCYALLLSVSSSRHRHTGRNQKEQPSSWTCSKKKRFARALHSTWRCRTMSWHANICDPFVKPGHTHCAAHVAAAATLGQVRSTTDAEQAQTIGASTASAAAAGCDCAAVLDNQKAVRTLSSSSVRSASGLCCSETRGAELSAGFGTTLFATLCTAAWSEEAITPSLDECLLAGSSAGVACRKGVPSCQRQVRSTSLMPMTLTNA